MKTQPNYYRVAAATLREYHGQRPCLPADVMMRLNLRLRPTTNMRPWVRLRPAVLPCGLYQDEIPF